MQTAIAANAALKKLANDLIANNDYDKAKTVLEMLQEFDQHFPHANGLTSEEMATALHSKIGAIKLHRTRTGMLLKESLDVVNAYLKSQGIPV